MIRKKREILFTTQSGSAEAQSADHFVLVNSPNGSDHDHRFIIIYIYTFLQNNVVLNPQAC
jgi:DNA-binding MurR/RpiR family transcriptional regulator